MEEKFSVKGMHCKSCEEMLKMDIGELAGVKEIKADFRSGSVVVKGDSLDRKKIIETIKKSGYKAQ
ncbi:heavy-metal-associated domain-containing protein [Candidatus Micrarchaeota archaeon]|nr:heavy-metal-associated domain-containing protein [Candidatus Micrarchaeota archaeon]